MEEWQKWWDENWPQWWETLQSVDPLYYGIGGGGFLMLLILRSMLRKRRKRKRLSVAPQLSIQSCQVAPLGRDAFIKIRNAGPDAKLSSVTLDHNLGLILKNSPSGQLIATGKEYSLLIESAPSQRIPDEFSIELTFVGPNGKAYQQVFRPRQAIAEPIRRL